MGELFLQVSAETLYDGVVVAVRFAGNRLDRACVLQECAPGVVGPEETALSRRCIRGGDFAERDNGTVAEPALPFRLRYGPTDLC